MTLNNNTFSDYISRINRVIDYILNNLGEELQARELAKVASFSEFHFQRIFKMITGEPLNTYTRRRRLEKSASVLIADRKRSITDIALSYGFSSSANFSKAFKAFFGITPSQQRQLVVHDGNTISLSKDGKRISRSGKLKNNHDKDSHDDFWNSDNVLDQKALLASLQIEIKERAPLHVAYVRVLKGYKHDLIEKAWDRLMTWAHPRGLVNEDTVKVGIVYDDPSVSDQDRCQYDACIIVPEHITDYQGEIGIGDISGGIYAIHSFMASLTNSDEISKGFFNLYTWIILNDFALEDSPAYMDTIEELKEADHEKVHIRIYVKIKPPT